ncbi:MAG: adenylate/guanylate cyclase domain-containing protein [Candidatus Binatia bacterium]|nr:adenylate/guanylate cyclase domain-containing protein [Candidatus Binatia bacterium]
MTDSLEQPFDPGAVLSEPSILYRDQARMRIRTILFVVLGVQLLLATGLIAVALVMEQTQRETEQAEHRRFESFQLADQLRQSSDDLTRFARTYAATGDEKYRKYFETVLAIRNGDAPRPEGYEGVYWDLVAAGQTPTGEEHRAQSLRDRMLEAGFTTTEFDKLSESQARSDDLVQIENVAINAMQGRFDDGTGNFAREGPPDRERAIQLLHGKRYHEAKATIMEPIGEFQDMIESRTETAVAALNDRERSVKRFDMLLACTLFLTTLMSVVLIRRRVLAPIEEIAAAADRVSSGDLSARAQIKGSGEIATFGATFDAMVTSVGRQVEELENAHEELSKQTDELTEQTSRSEHLLLNVLPATIADRLKGGEEGIADSFPEVSVLFSDIVGFTKMSERLGARQVVEMLNDVFGLLDALAKKHKLEKIKTIGDCYMVVAGVPDRTSTHAQQIAEFALDMQETLRGYAESSGRPLRMRTGIHTGTVVAGIVGTSKFAYDLWGDVVNVASRMESTSEPGSIQVSDAVRVRLQDDYTFEERGSVELKGKGPMNTWYLTGRRICQARDPQE